MNAEPSGYTANGDDEEAAALIERCGLTPEDIGSIRETMRAMKVRFSEAALHLGLVTQAEVAAITDMLARQRRRREASIVERVMRNRPDPRALKLPRLGTVVPGPSLIIAHDQDCEHSEQIRALRTDLLLLGDLRHQANMLAVLSPGSGEGRSQLAAELAIAFSQLGRRTLLVDADLRKPSQHLLFPAANDWGLGQCLTFGEKAPTYEVEGLSPLSLLTAGPTVSNSLELLSGVRFGPLINSWRLDYDFVIFDTPPAGPYADAFAVATVARRVLAIGRQEATSYKQMKGMLRRIAMTQAQVVGAVFNRF